MCPYRRVVLLYLQASAIQACLVIDAFCIRRQFIPMLLAEFVRTDSLDFPMIDCNSGHLCCANTLFYQEFTDTY